MRTGVNLWLSLSLLDGVAAAIAIAWHNHKTQLGVGHRERDQKSAISGCLLAISCQPTNFLAYCLIRLEFYDLWWKIPGKCSWKFDSARVRIELIITYHVRECFVFSQT